MKSVATCPRPFPLLSLVGALSDLDGKGTPKMPNP
jgi:hypothetical protein